MEIQEINIKEIFARYKGEFWDIIFLDYQENTVKIRGNDETVIVSINEVKYYVKDDLY